MTPAPKLGRFSLILVATLSAAACADDDASRTEGQSKGRDAGFDASQAREREVVAEKSDEAKPDEMPPAREDEDKTKSEQSESQVKDEPGANEAAKPENPTDYCGVMPIMQNNCQACHGETLAGGAPMSLTNYSDFMQPAKSDPSRKVWELVKERVHDAKKPMPPKGILKDKELGQLDAWFDGGAARAAAPCKPVDFKREKPDESWPKDCEDIYTITAHDPDDPSKPYKIPANSEIHPFIMVDAPWGDDEVQLLATRPVTDNVAAVHHWILWESKDHINLTFWAPGAGGDSFPDDIGLYMPKGKASMGLDMHYYNLGSDQPKYDRSGLQVCTTRKKLREKTATLYGLFGNANVPPMQRVVNSTTCTVKGELHLFGVNPHMHHLGVHARLELRRGGMDPTEVLYDGPFSFEDQVMRPLEDTLVKEGDTFTTTCTFENTTSRDIHFGESTEDEMCINWIRYYPKGGFSCSRMAPPDGSGTVDDPNSNGNGNFPTGDEDAGVVPPPT